VPEPEGLRLAPIAGGSLEQCHRNLSGARLNCGIKANRVAILIDAARPISHRDVYQSVISNLQLLGITAIATQKQDPDLISG